MTGRDPSTTGPGAPRRRRRARVGNRRRRLRLAAAVLTIVALSVVAIGVLVYRATRPEVRRPGEALEEITDRLSRGVPDEAPTPRFTDVTDAAGLGGFVTFVGERTSQLPEDMGSGAAWGDFDNDGDDDLFLVAAGGTLDAPESWAASRLYENLGDGTFEPVADFPEIRIMGMGAAWGDYDGDGWLDLVVSGYGTLQLLRNEEGRFAAVDVLAAPEGGYWSGVAWGDFDNDRDLDLYVCGYVDYEVPEGEQRGSQQYGRAVPYTLNPASFESAPNLLFRNEGNGVFTEVALLYGVSNPGGRSLGALWHDFDADGRLDLYVANDISDNALLLNRGDNFQDAGLRALVADYRGAMGLAAGDWNRDGDDDLFITHWIAQENALYDSRLAQSVRAGAGAPPRLSFSDLSAPLGLGQSALPMVGWGTEFADLDADGWLDLVVVNGSTLEDDGEPKRLVKQRPFLFWNEEGRFFHDLAPLSEPLAAPRVGRGLALADYDLDGDLDLLVVDLDGGVQLLRNDMDQGDWLQLRLRSRNQAGEPIGSGAGSTVVATAGDATLRRSVTGASYLSQSSRTLHVGLGDAKRVDRLEVRWLGGETETVGPLAANTVWEVTEGDPTPRRVAGAVSLSREETMAFWDKHRAAMNAVALTGDCDRAVGLFEEALAIDPSHEDARYYLANCLARQGASERALAELGELRRQNPLSHRGHRQWALLRATHVTSQADLEAAEAAGLRALEVNREETGTLLLLGEIALLRGDEALADERLALATRTNHKAVGGFFLRAYVAWREGRTADSIGLLEAAHAARSEDWKPAGSVAEGDVERQTHDASTPLSATWERWDGTRVPEVAFGELARRIEAALALPPG